MLGFCAQYVLLQGLLMVRGNLHAQLKVVPPIAGSAPGCDLGRVPRSNVDLNKAISHFICGSCSRVRGVPRIFDWRLAQKAVH